MAIPLYLAMSGAEFSTCKAFPEKTAWMACHFSLSHDGLSNIPPSLPPGSMVILDDSIPFGLHDPIKIQETLVQIVGQFSAEKLLLDFQRPYDPRLGALAEMLGNALPCPVGVSHIYGRDSHLPVFLPAQDSLTPMVETVAGWNHREIWLEIAGICSRYTVTKHGCSFHPLAQQDPATFPHRNNALCCHYRIETAPNRADFYLQSCGEDLSDYLNTAVDHGVTAAVGLYRELRDK